MINYYYQVAPYMLPYMKDGRKLSIAIHMELTVKVFTRKT